MNRAPNETELILVGLLVKLTHHYTSWGALARRLYKLATCDCSVSGYVNSNVRCVAYSHRTCGYVQIYISIGQRCYLVKAFLSRVFHHRTEGRLKWYRDKMKKYKQNRTKNKEKKFPNKLLKMTRIQIISRMEKKQNYSGVKYGSGKDAVDKLNE